MHPKTTVRIMLAATLVATVGCDHAAKVAAGNALLGAPRLFFGGALRLDYAENTGGFLSLGASLPAALRAALFTGATGVVLLGLSAAIMRGRWHGVRALALSLVVAGGLSNWIDRLMHGRVVDFLSIGVGPVRTGIFNVADVAITTGAVAFAVVECARYARSRQAGGIV